MNKYGQVHGDALTKSMMIVEYESEEISFLERALSFFNGYTSPHPSLQHVAFRGMPLLRSPECNDFVKNCYKHRLYFQCNIWPSSWDTLTIFDRLSLSYSYGFRFGGPPPVMHYHNS